MQYIKWVGQILHGNLGFSTKLNQSVTSLIAQDLPKTIILVALGLVVSLLFGIPLGLYQAVKRYTAGDYILTGISFLGYATPTFFVGLLLVEWFSIDIHLFPPFAPQGTTVGQILSQPRALVLPVVAYSFVLYALWSRYMRSSVMDNLVQDYVRTARAKGASERRVLWGHVLRNSLMSIVTLLGLSLPTLVAGALFIEVVFNYPGMGLAFYNAALNVDYQVLLGFTLIATLATIVGNLLADVSYAVLDPRVRYNDDYAPNGCGPRRNGRRDPADRDPRGHRGGARSRAREAAQSAAPRLGSVRREQARAGQPGHTRVHHPVLLRRPAPLPHRPGAHQPDQRAVPARFRAPARAATTSATTILGRLMIGGQTSLEVGFAAAIVAVFIGTLYGAFSGFIGGPVDSFLMRIVDAGLSIPYILMVIILSVVFHPDTDYHDLHHRRVLLAGRGPAGARRDALAAHPGVRAGGQGDRRPQVAARWCGTSCRTRSARSSCRPRSRSRTRS